MNGIFDLPLGFIYIQIGLAGIILSLLACVLSLIVWVSRGEILKALPSGYVVLAMPPMMLGIIPGAELIAVPIAFVAACLACFLHLQRVRSPEKSQVDVLVGFALLIGLSAVVIAFGLGSLSGSE